MTPRKIILNEIAVHEQAMAQQAENARISLELGNYSGAATACHRAHQARHRVSALYAVLGQLP